jgi:hypothetical protein
LETREVRIHHEMPNIALDLIIAMTCGYGIVKGLFVT